MAYQVTYVTLDLLTCTATEETFTCESIDSLEATTFDMEVCEESVESLPGLDTDCCDGAGVVSTYTGTGGDPARSPPVTLIAEYTTFDFGTCEVTDTTCEYVDYCNVTLGPCTDWSDNQQWPTILYLLPVDWGNPGLGVDLSPARALEPILMEIQEDQNIPPGPVSDDSTQVVWEGYRSTLAYFAGTHCFLGRLSFNYDVGSTISCGLARWFRDTNDPDIGCPIPDTESYADFNLASRVGNVLRLFPDPLHIEYMGNHAAGTDNCYQVFCKVVDASGLNEPPPCIATCLAPTYPDKMPASLVVTIVFGAAAALGTYSLAYSRGLWRGTRCALHISASDGEVIGFCTDPPNFHIIARFWVWDADGLLIQLFSWKDLDISSCDPVSIVGSTLNTITE